MGLGSNVGNRKRYIIKAIKEISLINGVNIIALSSLYETAPWGLKNQRIFLNCVIVCNCDLTPTELHKQLQAVEKKLGRKKSVKWGPREIDIDILFYGRHIIKKGSLVIPHPMIAERNFVLVPLNEVIPGFIHPVYKKRISTLLKSSKDKNPVKKYN